MLTDARNLRDGCASDPSCPPAAELHGGPVHRRYLPVKVVVEWLAAALLAALLLPLMLVLVTLVKLTSPGPAFYCQTRVGRGGRHFSICKLRTMTHNCEAATGAVWSTPNDARVTPLGRFLRDTHLDEMPQLLNVLWGDMALIGPRPERPEMIARIERAIPHYRDRLLVRPGVTGLAQMQLPPDTDLEGVRKKLAYDRYYVQHVSAMLDTRIALSTGLYFVGSIFNSLCKLVVKSYKSTVERQFEIEGLDDPSPVRTV